MPTKVNAVTSAIVIATLVNPVQAERLARLLNGFGNCS
jgi:hypothetical protein